MRRAAAILMILLLIGHTSSLGGVRYRNAQDVVEAEIIHGEEVSKLGKRVGYKIKIYFVNNAHYKVKARYSVYLGDEDLDTDNFPQALLRARRILGGSGYRLYFTTGSVVLEPREEAVVSLTTGITWTPRGSQEEVVVESVDRL